MATATSRAAAIEDALIEQLQARPGLAGVQVEIGPLGDQEARNEWIQIGTAVAGPGLSSSQEWGALGNRRRDEAGTIHGGIFVQKAGAGPAVIRACRDRAWELLAEVEAQLREDPKITGLANHPPHAQLTASEETRGMTPNNARYSVIEFTIEYSATLPRT